MNNIKNQDITITPRLRNGKHLNVPVSISDVENFTAKFYTKDISHSIEKEQPNGNDITITWNELLTIAEGELIAFYSYDYDGQHIHYPEATKNYIDNNISEGKDTEFSLSIGGGGTDEGMREVLKNEIGLVENEEDELVYVSPIESGNTIADDITALSQSGGESPLAKGKWIKITLNVDDISEPTQILRRTADGYNVSHTEAVFVPEDNYFEVFKDVSVEKHYHQFASTGEKDIYFMVTGEGNTMNYGAFADMVNITSVVFPENIVALTQWIGIPLEGCSGLTSVTFNSTRSYSNIAWSQFEAITTSGGTFHVRTELKNWWQNALTEKQQQGDTHPYVYWDVVDDAEEAGDGDALIATIAAAYTDIMDKFIRNVFEQQIGLNGALQYLSPLGHWGTVRDDVEELNTKIPTFTYDSETQTLHITTNTTD